MSAPVVAVATEEITRTLQNSHHAGLDFYFESLDTNLFPQKAAQAAFAERIRQKYRDRKPDVIIAGGPTPLQLMATSPNFFPDVPVVFVGSFREQAQYLDLPPRFTGVWFQLEPAKTLEIAARLKPDTRNVFIVGGVGPLDRLIENIIATALRPYEGRYKVTYLTQSKMPELQENLRKLPEHSIVIFALLFEDGSGRHFIPETQALPRILEASNAPVFQTVDVGLGSGSVGGYVASIAGQGHRAAEDVIKILDGKRPEEIPEAYGVRRYIFDWRAIKRWHLDEKQIPPDSVILFREPGLWDRYRPQIMTVLLIIAALSVLSIYLAFEIRHRKRAEAATAASLRFEHIVSELSAQFIDLPAERIEFGIRQALDRLVDALGVDRITVFKFSPDRKKLLRLYVSDTGAVSPPNEYPAEEFKWHVAKLLNKECVVVNRVSDLPIDALRTRLTFQQYGIKSGVAVPLEAEGSVFGCVSFVLAKRERVWTDKCVMQLRMIGQVISNTLIRKQTDEERLELSGLLINAQEAERTRLARELHDDFSQRIAVLAIDLEAMSKKVRNIPAEAKQKLDQLGGLVTGIGADLHSVSHRLHSATLDSLGLVDALDSLCDEFGSQCEIEVNFVHEQVPESVPPEPALCLFRIAQEGLRNVKKHSAASLVEVRLSGTAGGVHLSIADNGKGFSHGEATKRSGLGLRSMQERARLAGGRMEIHSSAGRGTVVEAWIQADNPVTNIENSVTRAKETIGG